MKSPANKEQKDNIKKSQDSQQGRTQNSEFAQKGPLLTKPEIKKGILILLIIIGVLATFFISTTLIKGYLKNKHKEQPVPAKPQVEFPSIEETKTEKELFAYLKDRSSIWVVDNEGNNKKKIFELQDEEKFLASLDWKKKNQLTYAVCKKIKRNENSVCSISTYNLENQSITPEFSDIRAGNVRKIKWSPELDYIAYISSTTKETNLELKSGSVSNLMANFLSAEDKSNTQSRILFTPDSQYIIYSTLRKTLIQEGSGYRKETREEVHPIIQVYKINGVKIDEIIDASDPFLIDNTKLGYKKAERLVYRQFGSPREIEITSFATSYNPEISPNKKVIAYWKNEGGFSDVLLGVFDSEANFHRNILRGIILPVWLSNDSVAGIKADGCIGQNCLLYEYQTTSLSFININSGKVKLIDQGKSISELTFENAN